jgi:hypothetical protein
MPRSNEIKAVERTRVPESANLTMHGIADTAPRHAFTRVRRPQVCDQVIANAGRSNTQPGSRADFGAGEVRAAARVDSLSCSSKATKAIR